MLDDGNQRLCDNCGYTIYVKKLDEPYIENVTTDHCLFCEEFIDRAEPCNYNLAIASNILLHEICKHISQQFMWLHKNLSDFK